jgi:hypothetical protein
VERGFVNETRLEVRVAGKHGLDVDDGRAVDGADAQTIFDDLAHGDRVKAYRIWAVGRARREYASKLTARVRAWMNLQDVAAGAMKPSDRQVAGEWAKSADAQKWEQSRSAAR